jgi:hypothetical protein
MPRNFLSAPNVKFVKSTAHYVRIEYKLLTAIINSRFKTFMLFDLNVNDSVLCFPQACYCAFALFLTRVNLCAGACLDAD